jgi:hypothetical protein
MKTKLMIVACLVMLVCMQALAFAGSAEGSIKSVDAKLNKLELSSSAGTSSWIAYNAETKWPSGVTNPETLVGRQVKITSDDTTQAATSVEEIKQAVAAASEQTQADTGAKAAM